MVGPIDGVLAIHNAFRADMAAIDDAALAAARGTPGLEATVERFRFFNEILSYHAAGEEAAVFPILDEVAPLVAEAYWMDHRRLDDALTGYEADIAKLQKKLSEARARQSSVVNRLESAENRYRLREMTNGDRVEDAFSRFEILERRVDEAEGRADALSLGYKKSLDEEIAELQAADKVADELAALKAAQASKQ